MSSFENYFYENIGRKIRFYREKRGLTQEQLAELLHKNDKYIGHIERHERNISTKVLIKLLELWQLQPHEFFGFENKFKF